MTSCATPPAAPPPHRPDFSSPYFVARELSDKKVDRVSCGPLAAEPLPDAAELGIVFGDHVEGPPNLMITSSRPGDRIKLRLLSRSKITCKGSLAQIV